MGLFSVSVPIKPYARINIALCASGPKPELGGSAEGEGEQPASSSKQGGGGGAVKEEEQGSPIAPPFEPVQRHQPPGRGFPC